jgi:uncharacterized protein (TIGR03905 family)
MVTYKTNGVCSSEIQFKIENDRVKEVVFIDGCEGNLAGISKLVEGMMVDEVINKLQGIKCGQSDTSCPAQLANALKNEWMKNNNN